MADEILKRDQNRTVVIAGVTDDAAQDIVMLRVDPTTKRLKTSSVITGGGGITSLNGETGGTQTFSSVNDTNVTLSIASAADDHAFTMGWAGQLAVGRGGTGLSTVAAGSVLAANSLDTLSAITSAAGTKYLKNDGGTISWDTIAGGIGGSTGATDNAVIRADGAGGVTIQASAPLIDDSGNITPGTDDGSALGTTALKWSDLFLASGSVVNFDNGDVTLTHSANLLTLAGGDLTMATALTATGVVTLGAASLVYPAADGNAGEFLQTDGALGLSFAAVTTGTADSVHVAVRKGSVGTITKGSPVYISGYNVGGWVEVEEADADNASALPAVGLASVAITNSATVNVFQSGQISGLVTNQWAVGDNLWVSDDPATTFGLTNTKPTNADDQIQKVAIVLRSHNGQGVVQVFGAGRVNDIPNDLTLRNGGALRTGVSAADTALIQAYDVDGASYTTFLTLTANNTPTATMSGITASADLNPTSADGAALGNGTLMWADLFLASGSVVNFNNGDVTLTHSANVLALGGGSLQMTDLTASEILITDASKNLVSAAVATYPSLTELTYVKGVTSAIQTQLDAKLALAGGTMTGDILLGETDIKLDAVLSADEKWSGTVITGTGGATIAVGDICYLASTGKWLLNDGILDGTDTGFSKQLGICVLASTDTNPIQLLVYGKVRSAAFPAFTVGSPVYLDDTAGNLVVAQPSTANFAIRIVGYALTAEELLFNPSNDYIVHV